MDSERPAKKTKLFADDDNSSSHDEESLTINVNYAKRFEHNKQREELQRLEEARLDEDSETSTDSEDEDEDGVLASRELDDQVQATLLAIRNRDPRIYDKDHKFYTDPEETEALKTDAAPGPKPMYLRDYHRKTLLEGGIETDNVIGEAIAPQTYDEEQQKIRNTLIKEIHSGVQASGANNEAASATDNDTDEEFLVSKNPASDTGKNSAPTLPHSPDHNGLSTETDPDAFLDKFISTKAWKIPPNSQIKPFESDDEEEEARAEAYEEAYNLRFEDPERSNEKLMTHARDSAARYSARKSGLSLRKRAREAERSRKEAERQKRATEKARLRQLKILEMEKKLQKIKDAAGLRDEALDVSKWSTFLEEAWDNENWEREMRRKFDETYYADQDEGDANDASSSTRRRAKKPKWDADIDINDLVPGFQDIGYADAAPFALSDDETPRQDGESHVRGNGDVDSLDKRRTSQAKDTKRQKIEKDKRARRERRQIENLVDDRLDKEDILANAAPKHQGRFRYRETSPITYGMTTADILMASDAQLNQYAGLKKLASFRTPDQKSKDKRRLGQKARLRQWRKEAFGNVHGPEINR